MTIARKIRNAFAHTDDLSISFNSPEIKKLMQGFPQNCVTGEGDQLLYVWHLQRVEEHLVETAGAHILKTSSPDKTQIK